MLLPLEGGEAIELHGTGLVLWDLLDRPTTIDEAASALAGRFGVPPDEVAADIGPVLGELVRRSVVTDVDGA